VSTNCSGKRVLLALALTIIERLVLAERPGFFVTAARLGGGKTTVLQLSKRTGIPFTEAARLVVRQCGGVLLPGLVLPFDEEELAGTTVADVLADPERFIGAPLADPIEGIAYGRGKAKIMHGTDGLAFIRCEGW